MLYLELFLTFFKIGLFTIGGGYAMLPLIQADVQAKGWMTAEELVNFIAVSESTPGPFAVNVSTYVGAELALPAAGVTPVRRPGTGRRAFFFSRTKDFLKAGFPLLTWSALQVLSFS